MSRFVDRIRHQFSDARPAKRASLILLILAAFSVVGTSAWAYWTTHGTGTASASTGTLRPPTGVVALSTAGTGTVHVTWTGSTLSNNTPAQGYYVTKTTGGTTTAACNSSDTTTVTGGSSASGCNDLNVPPATYTYHVIAVYNSWTAPSDPTGEVTVLAPQVVTWAPTTNVLTTASPLTPSTLASASGGAAISYSVISNTTASCTVNASSGVLTYTGAGSCVVRATAAATTMYAVGTLDVTFTVALAPQVVTWAPTTNVLTTASPLTPSTLASASGGAAISYSLISHTTTTCTVNASSGVLTYTGAGTCVVRATAAATSMYAVGTVDVTFTVTAAAPVTVTGVSPVSVFHGDSVTLTITGSGFQTGALVSAGPSSPGTFGTVTVDSATSIRVQFTAGNGSAKGTYNVTVTNSAANGSGSGTGTGLLTIT